MLSRLPLLTEGVVGNPRPVFYPMIVSCTIWKTLTEIQSSRESEKSCSEEPACTLSTQNVPNRSSVLGTFFSKRGR